VCVCVCVFTRAHAYVHTTYTYVGHVAKNPMDPRFLLVWCLHG
jgi:hypothetical protein